MRIIEAIKYIFPRGNYFYYVAYVSAIVVFGTMLLLLSLGMGLLVQGNYITTDTFTAHMTSMNENMAQDTRLWDTINLLSEIAFYGIWILLIHTLLSAVADLLYLVICIYRAVKRVIQERDDFCKAYPFDIAGGLILGGVISMCISIIPAIPNVQESYYLVGGIALVSGILLAMGIALSFNTGTHFRGL
jgi:hypothetical protein